MYGQWPDAKRVRRLSQLIVMSSESSRSARLVGSIQVLSRDHFWGLGDGSPLGLGICFFFSHFQWSICAPPIGRRTESTRIGRLGVLCSTCRFWSHPRAPENARGKQLGFHLGAEHPQIHTTVHPSTCKKKKDLGKYIAEKVYVLRRRVPRVLPKKTQRKAYSLHSSL